jgi:hypothetical protein
MSMDEKAKQELFQRAITAESMKQEFEQSLPKRVERYLQVKPHEIIPNAPFAVPSSECSLLFRDGHFYACIALVQAVTEAIVRYICDIDFNNHNKVFEKNIEKLHVRKSIDDGLKESLLKIWERRDDFHHLNSNVPSERQTLENLAKEKTRLLVEVEKNLFEYSYGNDGTLIPKYPKYWNIKEDKMDVFLRLDL